MLAINGASAALTISDIPWNGPLGAVRVARVNGQFVVNPTHIQQSESDLDLVYVGTEKDVMMIEGSAKEASEADLAAAMDFAQGYAKQIIAAQKQLAAQLGVQKRQIKTTVVPDAVLAKNRSIAAPKIMGAFGTMGKHARKAVFDAIFE